MKPRRILDRQVLETLDRMLIPLDGGCLRASRQDITRLLAHEVHAPQAAVTGALQRLDRNGWLTLNRGTVRLPR